MTRGANAHSPDRSCGRRPTDEVSRRQEANEEDDEAKHRRPPVRRVLSWVRVRRVPDLAPSAPICGGRASVLCYVGWRVSGALSESWEFLFVDGLFLGAKRRGFGRPSVSRGKLASWTAWSPRRKGRRCRRCSSLPKRARRLPARRKAGQPSPQPGFEWARST